MLQPAQKSKAHLDIFWVSQREGARNSSIESGSALAFGTPKIQIVFEYFPCCWLELARNARLQPIVAMLARTLPVSRGAASLEGASIAKSLLQEQGIEPLPKNQESSKHEAKGHTHGSGYAMLSDV